MYYNLNNEIFIDGYLDFKRFFFMEIIVVNYSFVIYYLFVG